MSRHVQALFEGSPLLALPLLALALFCAVFVAVVVRLVLQGAAHNDAIARSILDDEGTPRARPSGGAS